MLVYIRDSDRSEILKPLTNKDIPEHLIERFDREKQMDVARRKEREIQHFFQTIRIISDRFISDSNGIDLGIPDEKSMAANNELYTVRIRKDDKIVDLFVRRFEEDGRELICIIIVYI
jgi:hypothetical protein